jgi:hypothetical protein
MTYCCVCSIILLFRSQNQSDPTSAKKSRQTTIYTMIPRFLFFFVFFVQLAYHQVELKSVQYSCTYYEDKFDITSSSFTFLVGYYASQNYNLSRAIHMGQWDESSDLHCCDKCAAYGKCNSFVISRYYEPAMCMLFSKALNHENLVTFTQIDSGSVNRY